jgi:hypothetical protein
MVQLIRESAIEILEDEEDLKSVLKIMDNDEEMISFDGFDSKRKRGQVKDF